MNTQQPQTDTPVEPSLHEQEQARLANLKKITQLGIKPYGQRLDDLLSLANARAAYDPQADATHKETARTDNPIDTRPCVRVAGRVMLKRDTGKLVWLNLRDNTGDIQVAVSKRDCQVPGFDCAKLIDLGDVVVASGPLMMTRTGEITIWAGSFELASKSLTPPPTKHAGLQDIELRYRRRYVDLWANPQTMSVFSLRSKIIAQLRRELDAKGYQEVETPMLQAQAGGAAARPFRTHLNAWNTDVFLRIAPELYLKRLLVGGMPRVYEINRNFRNEGVDKQHNPEFTMLEAYCAFGDMETMMDLSESLCRACACEVEKTIDKNHLRKPIFDGGIHKGLSVGEVVDRHPSYIYNILQYPEKKWELPPSVMDVFRFVKANAKTKEDQFGLLQPIYPSNVKGVLPFGELTIDYARPFDRITYHDLFEHALGFAATDLDKVWAKATELGLVDKYVRHLAGEGREVDPGALRDHIDDVIIINELFEEVAEPSLDPARPTFITHYPSAISPLTRPCDDNPDLAQRADLFIGHMELAPHYTELNDPAIQEAKFRAQLAGLDDEENTFRTFDADFIAALKVGMPPAGGMGLGIDRLVMLLTNQSSIRDVLLFPFMKPQT